MSKMVLGLDLGSNSIGWALLEEVEKKPQRIIDLGSRIFTKAVEEKTPTPKNMKRRDARLARRVIQRRARRKQRMLNYLVSLNLLPVELQGHTQPEVILNKIGAKLKDQDGSFLRTKKGRSIYPNPYQLRAKALDEELSQHELGRVLLHLVQRRGFLSNRKTMLGDMIDDPDVLAILDELDEKDEQPTGEEGEFKQDISILRQTIKDNGCRTLGEYLSKLDHHDCKRNRARDGGHRRTDRQMYREELDLIWEKQKDFHSELIDEVKEQIEEIIFKQRPLKLKADRIGKCSLEPSRQRAQIARLEAQRFRYLQDINNLEYFDFYRDRWTKLTNEDRDVLKELFEKKPVISFAMIRKTLNFDKRAEFNLERGNKKLKGNITACEIREQLPKWNEISEDDQISLVEDLLTIKKKSVLKKRLLNHWGFDLQTTVNLCLIEFEPGHSNLSLKAIRNLLPHLETGFIYSDARQKAGYSYEHKDTKPQDKLGIPPEIPNPIVSKALHELRRVVNALIKEYGKPDMIRIEMARDLEMNTKRYKDHERQQKANTKSNNDATKHYQQMGKKYNHLKLSKYPSRDDKIRYRIWKDQGEMCAYSGQKINLSTLFSAEIDIDHILPYSQSLDDSYMNKVVCLAGENRLKGQRTPIDAFSGDKKKWEQIVQRIFRWHHGLKSKKNRFYKTAKDVQERDFISSQLNDTRYISKVANAYLKQLGADINVTKGVMTGWLRHQWNLNGLIGLDQHAKDRTDHRHHTIDAVVTACIGRRFYTDLVSVAKDLERQRSEFKMRDMHFDPPWESFREDLDTALHNVIVAHTPLRKLNSELHEDTGSGFLEGRGTVYRKSLSKYFDQKCDTEMKAEKKLSAIVDNTVAEQIRNHLAEYKFNSKEAFSEKKVILHKDKNTPIKRIRVYQSMQIKTQKKIEKEKFGAKNKQGNIFKWYAYGNIHHVGVFHDNKKDSYFGEFTTMFEAHRRAMTGTKSAQKRGVKQELIINSREGSSFKFIMAVHKQSTVSLIIDTQRKYYRVKSLGQLSQNMQPRLTLVPHTTAQGTEEKISDSINNLMSTYKMKIHQVNAIGKLIE